MVLLIIAQIHQAEIPSECQAPGRELLREAAGWAVKAGLHQPLPLTNLGRGPAQVPQQLHSVK